MKKAKRKIKKFTKKNKGVITLLLIAIILIFAISLFFNNSNTSSTLRAKYEITKTDIFTLREFNANDISVMGLMVGDRLQDVLEYLGTPDIQTDHPHGITNLEYSESLGLESTGLIINVNNGFVNAITIREPFNEYLIGETQIGREKKEIYQTFGKPENTIFMPIKQDSTLMIKVLQYQKLGTEFLIRKDENIGISFKLNDYEEPLEE